VVERDGVEVDWCPLCRGLWFDAGELELLAESRGRPLTVAGPNATPDALRGAGRRCPRCGKKMVTARLGGSVVDRGEAGGGETAGDKATGDKTTGDKTTGDKAGGGAHCGVVIDRCSVHGIWLDAGELAEVLRLVPAHGETHDAMIVRFLGETFGAGPPRRGDPGGRDG
jgi:Zn-finger nucleic acid-binding protein